MDEQTYLFDPAEEIRCIFDDNSKIILSNLHNQRTNGPLNAHLISGPRISTKYTKPGKRKVKK